MNDVLVACDDLSRAIEVLTGFGFRVDTIIAADDPTAAVLRGHGLTLRLSRGARAADSPELDAPLVPSFVVTRHDAGAWRNGRASMQYRDLIPDRQGGRFIASHIRVPDGGPVPDYVHFHDVRFQLIHCYKGWVRLVYEDQGEPFVMHAGEHVLQPPKIRHRVLEASPGLEVIEVGSPAVHTTHADHEMVLPTSIVRADRELDGQRFTLHPRPGSVGLDVASGGLVGANVRRAAPDAELRTHDHELYFGFVLHGAMTLTVAGEAQRLGEADAFTVPAGRPFALSEGSADLAWLEIVA